MEPNLFEGFSIQEDEDFSQGVPSLREIALMHIRKISQICCKEFTKGYWEERPLKVGGGIAVMKTYHEDQRAVFCNSVDFLVWIVYPKADDDFKKKVIFIKEENKEYEKGIIVLEDEDKDDWDAKIKKRKIVFRELNLMFERLNYFDTMTGRTERSK